MNDQTQTTGSKTKWLWVALLAVLAVVGVGVLLNPAGDADEVALSDVDEATAEERMLTDLDTPPSDEALEQVNGAGDIPANVDDVETVTGPDPDTATE
ncbi:hypothetical protein [Erythrobacter litoralis]|uniref:Uncharacterized protein n=1 Tax=Erythrobacter litoralis (strain HTCC2594) TaxID=314225 RepID=Q2N7E0_ERYLH|nr:hypothetical protein [Erythrobacter litoralis]ABC64401.1 hypothetical protein ELI_11545 [Erythrobacter litoralis HTCC2594]